MPAEPQSPADSPRAGERKILLLGAPIVAALVLVGTFAYPYLRHVMTGQQQAEPSIRDAVAQMEVTKGDVTVRRRDQVSWQEAKTGLRLASGDMIQTGGSGNATIKYPNGTAVSIPPETLFSIRHADRAGRKSLPDSARDSQAGASAALNRPEQVPRPQTAQEQVEKTPGAVPSQEQPTLELQRIVAFGRTLELIGRVDPGGTLLINDEAVDVSGDGSYKHFTKPFPVSAPEVDLILRVKDMRGRIRLLNASHNFGDPGER